MPAEKRGSPRWWLQKLSKQLSDRQRQLKTYDDYYEGRHPLAFASMKFEAAFGGLFKEFADNWCDLVVDAVEERLNVEGFRFGTDTKGDTRAWRIWQANQLDAESQLAHTEALVHGESFALVWFGEDDRIPEITIEHPTQVAVAYVAGSRRRRAAALKRWTDDDGFQRATVYLPDALYRFRSRTKRSDIATWADLPEVIGEAEVLNPLGVVPMVPISNRPRLLVPGRSEIHQIIPIQDAVNKLIADMLVTSEFTAAPQRWAVGLEIPKDPETGQPVAVFQHMVDRLWTSKSKDTKFGEFTQADLKAFVEGIQMLVQHIASRTRTPPHYFYLKGEFPSGESIKSAETGLVAKARRKMVHFGEGWEEVMRLGFAVIGDKRRARVQNSETIWGDPESRSESEHVDAVLKKRALRVPLRQLWSDLGYTPTQIEGFVDMLKEEAALGLAPKEPADPGEEDDEAEEGDPAGNPPAA